MVFQVGEGEGPFRDLPIYSLALEPSFCKKSSTINKLRLLELGVLLFCRGALRCCWFGFVCVVVAKRRKNCG